MKNALLLCCLLFAHYADGQVSLKLQLNAAQPIGDVDATPFTVNGGQLSVLYDLNSYFTMFGSLNYNSIKGKEFQLWTTAFSGGGLVESYYQSDTPYQWCPAFSSDVFTSSTGILFNLNTMNGILNLHIGPGIGLTYATTYVDLLDANQEHYDLEMSFLEGPWGPILITGDEYDGEYETKVTDLPSSVFTIHLTGGFDIRLNEKLAISADYSRMILSTDYLDGIKFRTAVDETYRSDSIHFISLGLKYSLLGNVE